MGSPLKIAFIKASWHADIVDQALTGFTADMDTSGTPYTIDTISVPGAYEMPLQAQRLAKSGKFDAIVAAALVVDGGITVTILWLRQWSTDSCAFNWIPMYQHSRSA